MANPPQVPVGSSAGASQDSRSLKKNGLSIGIGSKAKQVAVGSPESPIPPAATTPSSERYFPQEVYFVCEPPTRHGEQVPSNKLKERDFKLPDQPQVRVQGQGAAAPGMYQS